MTSETVGVSAARSLRVLFASRWYPSFDLPFRGTFVADLASAASDAGMEVEVVSWETVVDGRARLALDGQPRTPGLWLEAVRDRGASVAPRSWGAPGISVVRLPGVTRVVHGVRDSAVAVAETEAESLLAWATGPAFVRPSIIHAHTGLPDGVAAIALADRLGVPLVTTEHESTAPARLDDPVARAAYLRLVEDGRVLLAVSAALRDSLARALGVDPARIGVVPNPVDVAPFLASSRVSMRNLDELLWVGNRQANKGSDTLLGAFALLRADRPGLRLRMIGRSPSPVEDERLRRLARDLEVADAVSFEPQAPRAEVAAAMARAGVFVHPSPSETFGIVAAEALAAGLPVAAVPSGGVEEILGRDGRLGVLAADAGPAALAAAVDAILSDPARFDQVAMADSITSRFAPHVVAARLQAVYEAQLDAHARRQKVGGPGHAGEIRVAQGAPSDRAGALGSPDVLVLALTAVARNRIAALPQGLRDGLAVVTYADRGTDEAALSDGPRWIRLDPMRAYKAARAGLGGSRPRRSLPWRIVRTVRHPRRTLELRRLAAQGEAIGAAGLRDDLRAVADGLVTAEALDIVVLMAEEVDLVASVLGDRVRLWPGTFRGFVDAWDAAGRPARAQREPAAPDGAYDPTRYWARLHERRDLSTVGQSARSAALNRWLYRAFETNLRSFVRRHGVAVPLPSAAFDIGIGIGYWVRFWRGLGIRRVDGCDLISGPVESAMRAAAEQGVEGEYLAADVGQPGVFGGRTYPLVSCFNVLLHVVDDDAFGIALKNAASLVEPGGWLVLAEPILLDATRALPYDPARHSRARPLAAYRDPLVEAGLELVALEPATVLANNPQEAGSLDAWRRLERWWRFVVRQDRAGSRWIGPLVVIADRVAMRTGAAPTTKFALFRRPPAR